MAEAHEQRRIDRLIEGVARLEAVATAIDSKLDAHLTASNDKTKEIEERLRTAEKKMAVVWIMGPLLLGAVAFAKHVKDLFVGHG